MKKNVWLGPALMILAALACVLLAQWHIYRVQDEGSPISFQEYKKSTQEVYQRLGLEPMDYDRYEKLPFYCTEEMLEEELLAIQEQGESGRSPISFKKANEACVAAFAKYGVEGGLYPPENGERFYCTPVMLDNTVRYLESVARAQQQKETAGDGAYVNQ